MKVAFFSLLLLFLQQSVSALGKKRLLEVEPDSYIKVNSEDDKFKLMRQGHKVVDVSDVLGYSDVSVSDSQPNFWKHLMQSLVSFAPVFSGLKKRSEASSKPKFWHEYQVFSFQDLLFDDSILITEETITPLVKQMVKVELPATLSQQKLFDNIYGKMHSTVQADLFLFINHFTQFYTRFYKSSFGREASDWLFSQAAEAIEEATALLPASIQNLHLISVAKFPHESFIQNSILIKIQGSRSIDNPSNARSLVLGSHLDSINHLLPYLLRAPGVDDNATGTAVSYLIFKAYMDYLVNESIVHGEDSNKLGAFWPVNDVEFHFYAAEEGGLLGSLDVFASKSSHKEKVLSMLQLDQLGYNELKEQGKIGLVNDFVSEDVVEFLKQLIANYLSVGFVEDTCGYGCSDHASAYKYGFPSGMVSESALKNDNKFTHGTLDTIDRIDLEWLEHFVKLGLFFVLELASYEV